MNTDETKKGTIKFRKSLIFKMILAVAISLYISSHISNFINDQIDKVDKINGSLEVTINTFVSLFIGTFIISLCTRFIVIKRIDKVLNAMTFAAKGDLTIRLEDKSKDEIGQLSYYFNNMIDNIETVIQKAKKASLKVSSYTEEFTSIADQNSSSVEKIANFNKGIVSGSDVQVNNIRIVSSY
ncbi:HAMP domain-containing protein [Lysinibacillus sp. NPDC093692]|uniref:HAMP domain-containing protein n=1 Tax=Lysinibacillus sp. NPDC093692 TaxID=3390578 RepID=UPI003D03BF30